MFPVELSMAIPYALSSDDVPPWIDQPTVKPLDVVHWLLKLFPTTDELSFTLVVTRILYVLDEDKFEDGEIVNVLLELDAVGEEAIWIQELKLFEETWRLPEQVVPEVLVVIVELSIPSEKVIDTAGLRPAEPESAGEDEETVGADVSIIKALFAPREPDELGEGRVNVASLFKLSLIVPLFSENEFEAL